MSVFTDNKNFYPSSKVMVKRMIDMIDGYPDRVLEPSAGDGTLVEALQERFSHRRPDISCIEIDPHLQGVLTKDKRKLIDTDFLAFAGPDKFDLIFMNPPFDNGDKHLMKAMDVLYRGQIICQLNAETLRSPNTKLRKELVRRLKEAKAEIKYYKNAYTVDAARKTKVDVALVNIKVKRSVEEDLFGGMTNNHDQAKAQVKDKNEISTGKTIDEAVADYNRTVQASTETIINFYRNYNVVGRYMDLRIEDGSQNNDFYISSGADLTERMQTKINHVVREIRKKYWRDIIKIEEISKRMTQKKIDEFNQQIEIKTKMDFTESNIRQFIINLVGSYENTLTEATLEIFDKFTIAHCWDDGLRNENILHFNGWKTNKAYKVGKRVVVPISASYGNPFRGWNGWELDHSAKRSIDDIDKVMNYFDGMKPSYKKLTDAIEEAFKEGRNNKIVSEYFTAICYKKGTIHLTFNDENILRRFNVAACLGKGWLPNGYGQKKYGTMNAEEKAVVNEFEGQKSYTKNVGKALFGTGKVSGLLALPEAA